MQLLEFLCITLKSVLCAASAHRIIGSVFFKDRLHFYHCVQLILMPLLTALDDVFTKWFITHRLWLLRSSGLNPCNYYMLETLKDGVCVNNPCSKRIANTSKQELCYVLRNIFRRCKALLEAGGWHLGVRLCEKNVS
jgi:hypothetical protein